MVESPAHERAAEVRYLKTARAVRERCEAVRAAIQAGTSEHWRIEEAALPTVVEYVASVTRRAYPDLRAVPYHGRFAHFGAGGVDRLALLSERLAGGPEDERLMAEFELVITSVLLDAGAGSSWSYRDSSGSRYTRSEGLAVASFELFSAGGLSDDPAARPYRVDTRALENLDAAALGRAFQVDESNALIGLGERAELLRRLGAVVRTVPAYFGAAPRLGHLALWLRDRAAHGEIAASSVLEALLDAFGPIWPGRENLSGVALGDVWSHSGLGRVPFHKLSQWLTYSLCEPLQRSGIRVVRTDELTGLAEYRNGGLFVDGGVLVPKHAGVLAEAHDVRSDVVIEWRAATVSLLDDTAAMLRALLGLSAEELPLVRVLEGGTWRAGRALAAEKRADGSPPLRVRSDGTVF